MEDGMGREGGGSNGKDRVIAGSKETKMNSLQIHNLPPLGLSSNRTKRLLYHIWFKSLRVYM